MKHTDVDWEKYGVAIPHCLAPWKASFIQADGFVRPCCIYPPTMGNTNDKKLEAIWNDEPYRKLRLAMLGKEPMPEICANCHDSMRHLDIEWYLRHAIQERIEQSDKTHRLEELLTVLIRKNYMSLLAICLLSKIYRKHGEYLRELYCLLSVKDSLDSSDDLNRIEELSRSLKNKVPHDDKVRIDAAFFSRLKTRIVFFSRLETRMPELDFEFEKMIGREYSSVDEYMKDMTAINGKVFLAPERKRIMLEYKLYNNPVLLEKRMRYADILLRLVSETLRVRNLFLRLPNQAYQIFDRLRNRD